MFRYIVCEASMRLFASFFFLMNMGPSSSTKIINKFSKRVIKIKIDCPLSRDLHVQMYTAKIMHRIDKPQEIEIIS